MDAQRFIRSMAGPVLLALVFAGFSTRASAQGYGLYEQGGCMMGRAGAGVAAPCADGSSIFFNPAGLALDRGAVASLGGTAIAPRGTFTNDTTARVSSLRNRTFFAPTLYAAVPWRRAVIGLGLFAPYGLTSEWPATAEGRFVGYKSSVQSIYVQPTIAVRLTDDLVVGAGVDITHTSVELKRHLDLSTIAIPGAGGLTFAALGVPSGTDFANVSLTGSGVHAGAHLGFILKANDQVSFGGRYLFGQRVSIDNGELTSQQISTGLKTPVPLPGVPAGTPIDLLLASQFGTGALLGPQKATTSLPLPDQLVLGGAYRASKELQLFVDYQYTHWSMFKQLVITNAVAPAEVIYGHWKDTHGVRIGGEYTLANGLVFRAGFDAHTAAEPDEAVTPILPEAPRRELAVGAGIPLGSRMHVDVAYMYIHQNDRAGRSIDTGAVPPTVALNNGVYHYYANLFGASLVFGF